jgi:hypothetical protein
VTAPVRKHPIKSALGATGIGAVALSDYGARAGTQGAQVAAAPAASAAVPRNTANADRMADQIMAGLGAVEAEPTLPRMAQQLIDSQGGGISLRQLGALSEVAQRAAPKGVKAPRPQDVAVQRLQSYYDGLHAAEVAELGQAQADKNWAARYEDLAKMSPIDQMLRADFAQEEPE